MSTKQIITIKNIKALDVERLNRKVFVFVLDVIEFTEILKQNKKEPIATELLQTATIWGENINEARSIKELPLLKSKIEIALHEADKIKYWLNLCKYSNCCPTSTTLLSELNKIIKQMKNKEIIINQLNIGHR